MTTVTRDPAEPSRSRPALPEPRGDLSAHLLAALRTGREAPPWGPRAARADALGEDLQLALYVLYELHRHGFEGLPDTLEWEPNLLGLRRTLERRFVEALRGLTRGNRDVAGALADLLVEPVGFDPTSVSHYLGREGEAWQLREYTALRSPCHLCEGDAYAWALPRLYGAPRAGLVRSLYDSAGGPGGADGWARLYAELMVELGLEPAYGGYVDAAPGELLAVVNAGSLFGLHRSLRGAAAGRFAAIEITSPPASRRLSEALRRTGAGQSAVRFHEVRAATGADHEETVRADVIGDLLAWDPGLERDVVLGIETNTLLEDRLAAVLLERWRDNRTALLSP